MYENLKHHPQHINIVDNSIVLAAGDMHGNAMKLIYFLIKEGVLQLENEAEDYEHLRLIYLTPVEQLTTIDLAKFKAILNNATLQYPKQLILLGDEMADRGMNDWYILQILDKLDPLPFDLCLSNHSSIFLQRMAENKPHAGVPIVAPYQQQSLNHLFILISKKIITLSDVQSLVKKNYHTHLKLIAYHRHQDDITLFTHAVVGLETITQIADKLGVNYQDETASAFITTLDQINNIAKHAIENGTFANYFNIDCDISDTNNPITDLLWARELKSNFTLKPHGRFNVRLVHGHVGPTAGYGNVQGLVNLDSLWGMFLDDDVSDAFNRQYRVFKL